MSYICSVRHKKPVVAVLQFRGTISIGKHAEISLQSMEQQIQAAFEMPGVCAVALVINSPGGAAVQSELIHQRIRALADEHEIPVYAFIEDVGASGGYMIACAADEIYALTSSIVGSIGVVSSGFGFHGLIEKLGIERRVYTQGANKAILDPFVPEKSSDVEFLKSLQADAHDSFISLVKTRRDKLTEHPDLFSGLFWSGKRAMTLGLVDGIGYIHNILDRKFGKHVELLYIKEKSTLIGSIKSAIGLETLYACISNISTHALWTQYGF